jgi:hypothetical protein
MSLFNIVGATVKLPQPGATSSKYFPILSFPTVPDARLGFQIASPCSRRSYKYTVRHIEPRSPSGKDQMRGASGSMYPGTLDYVRHCAVLHRDAPRSPCSKRYLGVSSDLWSRFVLSGCVLEQGGYPSNEKEVWKKNFPVISSIPSLGVPSPSASTPRLQRAICPMIGAHRHNFMRAERDIIAWHLFSVSSRRCSSLTRSPHES